MTTFRRMAYRADDIQPNHDTQASDALVVAAGQELEADAVLTTDRRLARLSPVRLVR
jgi:predicted nucleic acid-binding protein